MVNWDENAERLGGRRRSDGEDLAVTLGIPCSIAVVPDLSMSGCFTGQRYLLSPGRGEELAHRGRVDTSILQRHVVVIHVCAKNTEQESFLEHTNEYYATTTRKQRKQISNNLKNMSSVDDDPNPRIYDTFSLYCSEYESHK